MLIEKPEKNNTKYIKNILVIVLSIALLWFTIKNSGIRWKDLILTYEQYAIIFLAICLFIVSIVVQSLKAKLIWQPSIQNNRNFDTLNGIILGNFYNCILPGNLGEGVRIWHLSKKNHMSVVKSVASVIVEKYIDAYAFVAYIVFIYIYNPAFYNYHTSYLLGLAAIILAIITLYLLYIKIKTLERLGLYILLKFKGAGKWLYKLHIYTKSFLIKFTPANLMRFIVLAALMFVLNIAQYYLVMKATGISAPVFSLFSAMIISTLMVIIYLIPSAPGNVGVVHFGIYNALIVIANMYGATTTPEDLQKYAAFSVYLHLSYFLPEVLLGLAVLLKENKWLV